MRLSTFYLAERFGKLVHEVEALTTEELAEYLAYFKIKHDEETKASKKKSPSSAPRRRR